MRFRTVRRLTFLVPIMVLGLVFAAVVSACGGEKAEKVDLDDWVDDICDATETLATAEDTAVDAYFDVDSDDSDDVRDGFADYVEMYDKALDRFGRSAERAGEPEIDKGDKVAEAVQLWVEEEKKNIERAERGVRDLDTVDEIDAAFEAIKLADFLEFLEDTKSSDLNDIVEAFDDIEPCSRFLFVD